MKQKITMNRTENKTFSEVFELFTKSRIAKGVSDTTIRNYKQHLHSISKYLDITIPFDDVTGNTIDDMIIRMRNSDLAHNSIATYLRVLKTFFTWCNEEQLSDVKIKGLKEKETVKELYAYFHQDQEMDGSHTR